MRVRQALRQRQQATICEKNMNTHVDASAGASDTNTTNYNKIIDVSVAVYTRAYNNKEVSPKTTTCFPVANANAKSYTNCTTEITKQNPVAENEAIKWHRRLGHAGFDTITQICKCSTGCNKVSKPGGYLHHLHGSKNREQSLYPYERHCY